MTGSEFFPKRSEAEPKIYAYELPGVATHRGFVKVGFTARDVETRIREQLHTAAVACRVLGTWHAMRSDGTAFTDRDVHAVLAREGCRRLRSGEDRNEWFRCSVDNVRAAVLELQSGVRTFERRTRNFGMRPEQEAAVAATMRYYRSLAGEKGAKTPKFLWNAKMRFGKTFAAYQLAKRMGMRRLLILTFKPAVQTAWREDVTTHLDFDGWQFIARPTSLHESSIDAQYRRADKTRPIVCFGSFQDFLGVNRETGGIKARNEWVHEVNWDLVVFDEYHYGAWRENAKKLFESEDEEAAPDDASYRRGDGVDETWLPITAKHYLFLSGTPFRALNSGEFIEEQIYNWTYADEQRAKAAWRGAEENPYAALPKMVLMTYRVSESIRAVARRGEFDEFDLNVFFAAEGEGDAARFVHEDYVQKWLDLVRGAFLETDDELRLGAQRPPMPFSHARLLDALTHTVWYLPGVASCFAMRNLLRKKHNVFYHDYTVNTCAGTGAGVGAAALEPVRASMENPLKSKTITLSCGKLMTGVTVRPWSGIFMLCNLASPETYFQAAFRVQSPWEIRRDDGRREILKEVCYVFDFAIERALRQISDYSCRLDVKESNPERKVGEFIGFLPVLAYDGSAMRQVSATDILDFATAGTSATLLAKRWESALLVNVDNDTLARLLASKEAMAALMKIEGFRSLNQDIQTIINKSEAVKKAKKEKDALTPKEKRQLTEAEKEYKSKRKEIQEKLIKFATRVPVFMYLTDYRENSLKDVITKLEPGLFRKVTGLEVKDFELLVSLDVFNESLMNDAVYKFKRYEDASLAYTGVNRHDADAQVGLFSTALSPEDYARMG